MRRTCPEQALTGRSRCSWAALAHFCLDSCGCTPRLGCLFERALVVAADSLVPGWSEMTHNSPSGTQERSPRSYESRGWSKQDESELTGQIPPAVVWKPVLATQQLCQCRLTWGDGASRLCSRAFRCWFSVCRVSSRAWVIWENQRKKMWLAFLSMWAAAWCAVFWSHECVSAVQMKQHRVTEAQRMCCFLL